MVATALADEHSFSKKAFFDPGPAKSFENWVEAFLRYILVLSTRNAALTTAMLAH